MARHGPRTLAGSLLPCHLHAAASALSVGPSESPPGVWHALPSSLATLLTLAADPRRIGAQIGFLAVLHTWDQQMRPHPHLHCLVPAGGIAPNHSRWIRTRHPRFFLPGKVLAKMFRGKFLALLSRAYRRNKLRLCGALTACKKPATFDRLFRQLKRLDWVVDAKAPFGSPEHVLKYLARYTHRVAISNGRLIQMQDGQVTFRWRDSANGNQQKLLTLDAVEFIRRFLLHILPPGFVKIRHFGFLAHPHRRSALLLCRKLLRAPTSPNPRTDVQPKPVEHRCPRCGIGTLCFLGWIPAGNVIDVSLPFFVDSS